MMKVAFPLILNLPLYTEGRFGKFITSLVFAIMPTKTIEFSALKTMPCSSACLSLETNERLTARDHVTRARRHV